VIADAARSASISHAFFGVRRLVNCAAAQFILRSRCAGSKGLPAFAKTDARRQYELGEACLARLPYSSSVHGRALRDAPQRAQPCQPHASPERRGRHPERSEGSLPPSLCPPPFLCARRVSAV